METLVNSGIKSNFLPPPFLPYNYQVPIIKDMIQVILDGKSGLVIQPTATGKSVEAAFTARACILLHNMRGLYLYNENEGIEQARLKFLEVFAGNDILCGNFFGYGRDEFVYEADMVFASFQSFNSQHGKWYSSFEQNHFDFIIVNEAHHSQADTYKEVIEHFQCAKIGMTATEKRMDGRDIRDLFPHIICEIRLEYAIAQHWVAGLQYITKSSGLSTQRLKQIVHDVLEEGKRVTIKQLNENIFIEGLDREMLKEIYQYAFPEDGKPRQTLIFCENINHAKHVLKLLQEDNKSVEAIHSKQGPSKNRFIMKEFREGRIQFLLSIDKLNEDIDVPEAELGVFIRATNSENIFFQQLGRLLRRTKVKTKAIILDFVANVDRLVTVQTMQKTIEEFTSQGGEDLFERGLMHVSGAGFEFSFSEELIDLMQVLRVIREGFYPTWEQASAAVISKGLKGQPDYKKKYRQIDLRLPSHPEISYDSFPGWNKFLGREIAPVNWKTSKTLSEMLAVSTPTLRTFVNKFRSEHPKWFKYLWPLYSSSEAVEHYHPQFVKLITKHYKMYKLAPKGWLKTSTLSKQTSSAHQTIKDFAGKFRSEHPEWFKKYYLSGIKRAIEHYHPKLVKLIINYFTSQLTPPEGWLASGEIVRSVAGCSIHTVKLFANTFRSEHPEWFKDYRSTNIICEHYHPELVKLIQKRFPKRQPPPEGWERAHTLGLELKATWQTIKDFANTFRPEHPEWFEQLLVSNGKLAEHYHPELVEIIRAESKLIRKECPPGWLTIKALSSEGFAGRTAITTFANGFRDTKPEWFSFFFRQMGSECEHYHPDLVQKIKDEFAKKK